MMLFIVRNRTKKGFILGIRIMVTLFIFALVVSHLYSIYQGNNVIKEGWLRDDRPSGNPVKVENRLQPAQNDNQNMLDQFVVKLRDFYQKDQ